MLYSCTYVAPLGVKGLSRVQHIPLDPLYAILVEMTGLMTQPSVSKH